MAIVLDPPEWRKKKGLRRNISDAKLAVWTAVQESAKKIFEEAARHWHIELALAAGYVIAVLLGLEAPGTHHLPLLLAAIMPPLTIYTAALFASFMVVLLWRPFMDHRKIVWERDWEHQARAIENKQHWVERMKLELRLGLRQVEQVVPQMIGRLRDAEDISDERARQRATGEASPRMHLADWSSTVGTALSNGGLNDLAAEFSDPLKEQNTADELETTYQQLREIVDSVIAGRIQP